MIHSLLTFLSCVLLGIATPVYAFTLKPVQVAPDIYAFIGETGPRTFGNYGMNANTGFVVTKAGVVVIDSGTGNLAAQAIHQAIHRVTRQPVKYVINTGGQDQRWLGNAYFKKLGAEIIAAHPARADMQERGWSLERSLRAEVKDHFSETTPVYPTRWFDKEEAIRLGGTEIRLLYFFGGHTPGDSVVWLPQAGVLFSGDLVYVERMLGVMPYSNAHNWLASFEAMEQLKPAIIVPGHGKVCTLAQAQRETRDYLVMLLTAMKQAQAEGEDLQTAVDALDQSAFSHLRLYKELKGRNAVQTYLEVERD